MLPTVDEVFAGRTLKASDFVSPRLLTISAIDLREFKDAAGKKTAKYVINFEEEEKDFVCNQINSKMIAKYYGVVPEKWVGKQIVLFKADVQFGNEIVEGIRVRMPKSPIKKNPNITTGKVLLTPPESENPADDMDDSIPF